MAKFKVLMTRAVTIIDKAVVEIEAVTAKQAGLMAEARADDETPPNLTRGEPSYKRWVSYRVEEIETAEA